MTSTAGIPSDVAADITAGPDDVPRCPWVGADPDYIRYHDQEWGRPLHGDRPLFEKIALEGFQAGLSWLTILRKRPRFREVFAGFDPAVVARFDEDDISRLMGDAGIIRNRAKIEATITNARLVDEMDDGALDELVWSFAPEHHERPRELADFLTETSESKALSKELRRRGFKFVGPTTMHALMQSAGLIDDHLAGCFRAA
ncbi:DNA-3-methyladenine glycosylase I [Propionibacteriaceae bacterium G57]|uniref:DNA-3-methyladenine glycosylase I n=1 Tax=Aestuariimicrobium sp. G57 TaxID=3418485 RepID=UPI003DA739FC